ncbi:hypothetical protein LC085_16130 [Bacillus tianshenii]|uniref:hypothetical protein n=1 Tax=Sutcliffiella tianshenii TaxID=1463404 RepID=UPI001CD4BA2B|nr:hypothetical protein [Bacillus tianshenii]MCA1321434.1 hypothetical protein [Bacillus tianshenii]
MKKSILLCLLLGFIFSSGHDVFVSQPAEPVVEMAGPPDMVSPLKDEHPDPLPNG